MLVLTGFFCHDGTLKCEFPRGSAMKTSLLLIGLVMGAGIVGTAQATDTTACQHLLNIKGQTLAAASTTGSGVLSDLSNLLSGQKPKTDSTTTGSDTAATTAHAAQGYRHQPGPVQSAAHHTQHDADNASHGGTTAPIAIRDGGDPAPANPSPDSPPTLGWQSLLPGSIQ